MAALPLANPDAVDHHSVTGNRLHPIAIVDGSSVVVLEVVIAVVATSSVVVHEVSSLDSLRKSHPLAFGSAAEVVEEKVVELVSEAPRFMSCRSSHRSRSGVEQDACCRKQ